MNGYLYLAVAIVSEVVATSALKASEGFARVAPSVITCVGYAISFWFMSQAMKTIPVGIAYGIWSGVGIILITAIAWVLYRQTLDLPAMIGMGLILVGVVVINVFSKAGA